MVWPFLQNAISSYDASLGKTFGAFNLISNVCSLQQVLLHYKQLPDMQLPWSLLFGTVIKITNKGLVCCCRITWFDN